MERESFKYTANYCEENIWHLCQEPNLTGYKKSVLIISNDFKNCPFYAQKSGQGTSPVWWDYHVVLLAYKEDEHLLFDFDSTLPFPSSLSDYLRFTFPNSENWLDRDLPFFKAIAAEDYACSFSSDRSHMKDGAGNWIFAPPPWEPIVNVGILSLQDLMIFSEKCQEQLFSLQEMQKFSKNLQSLFFNI
jgi:protein N-terminal glutamine amidohydrolase